MAAQKGKGHVPPDRTKRYDVVEKPTAGPKKGTITRVFETNVDWDTAAREKERLAARRVTKYATIVESANLVGAVAQLAPPASGRSLAEQTRKLIDTLTPREKEVLAERFVPTVDQIVDDLSTIHHGLDDDIDERIDVEAATPPAPVVEQPAPPADAEKPQP